MDKSSGVTQRKHMADQMPDGHDALQLSDVRHLLQSTRRDILNTFRYESNFKVCLLSAESRLVLTLNTISDVKSELKCCQDDVGCYVC